MDKEAGERVPDFTASQLSTLQYLNSALQEETCHFRDLLMIMVKNLTTPRRHSITSNSPGLFSFALYILGHYGGNDHLCSGASFHSILKYNRNSICHPHLHQ